MNQPYFVVEFAHSLHGRVKRIQITHKSLGYLFLTLLGLGIVAFGMCSSYLRMTWKVSHYNQLRADFDHLRTRYQELQRLSRQHNEQMASLETLASEVTVAYGINGRTTAEADYEDPAKSLAPNVKESIEQYNFLKAASFGRIYRSYAYRWQTHTQPSLWPVEGIVVSSFGGRTDPFSGEGAFHTGIDLSVPTGTSVRVSADGVVSNAGWSGNYGRLIVVDHGNGLETYYGHLSQLMVVPGQEVRRGDVIALSGCSGRATGPHVHYEVRLRGTPINPYKYLGRPPVPQIAVTSYGDLGL